MPTLAEAAPCAAGGFSMRGGIGLAAAILLASAGSAPAQTYFYSNSSGNAGYGVQPWNAAYGASAYGASAYSAGRYANVGPANYTWLSPHLGYSVAPNNGVPNAPQVTGRIMPRQIRFVPYAATTARRPIQAVAATEPEAVAPAAQPDAEGFVKVPRENPGETPAQPVAATSGTRPPAAEARAPANRAMTYAQPRPYPVPLRAPPRTAIRSAYATPIQSRDGKADWAPLR